METIMLLADASSILVSPSSFERTVWALAPFITSAAIAFVGYMSRSWVEGVRKSIDDVRGELGKSIDGIRNQIDKLFDHVNDGRQANAGFDARIKSVERRLELLEESK